MKGPYHLLWDQEKRRTKGLHHHNLILREQLQEARKDLAIARAQQTVSAEELVDVKAELRRLEQNHQFLVDCRFEQHGSWIQGEGPPA